MAKRKKKRKKRYLRCIFCHLHFLRSQRDKRTTCRKSCKELNEKFNNKDFHLEEYLKIFIKTFLARLCTSLEWESLKQRMFKTYDNKCSVCNATEDLHIDHIKPKSIFPELSMKFDNLHILCNPCNMGKGTWDWTDWRDINEKSSFLVIKLDSI